MPSLCNILQTSTLIALQLAAMFIQRDIVTAVRNPMLTDGQLTSLRNLSPYRTVNKYPACYSDKICTVWTERSVSILQQGDPPVGFTRLTNSHLFKR